ncbi:hypothetical protein [Agrobacterium rosae]|uniref:hypothetical protein n=1 Tax=Agrobacterium rosae TaxID=1972867 RepID=UPI003A7F76A7
MSFWSVSSGFITASNIETSNAIQTEGCCRVDTLACYGAFCDAYGGLVLVNAYFLSYKGASSTPATEVQMNKLVLYRLPAIVVALQA